MPQAIYHSGTTGYIRHNVKYKNLDFWIKISDNNSGTFPESINMQIEEILTKYSKM